MTNTSLLFVIALVFLVSLATSSEFEQTDFESSTSPLFPFTLDGVAPFAPRDVSSFSSSSSICPTLECDRELNEPCNTSCSYESDCHYCNPSIYCSYQGNCTEKKKVGEICFSSSECPSDVWTMFFGGGNCVYNITEGLSRCSEVRYPGMANDGCTDNNKCQYGLNCSNSVCVGKPEGAGCYSSGECAFGLSCFDSNCTTQIPEGGSCDSQSGSCEDGTSCMGGVCVMPYRKKEGDSCNSIVECEGGLFCNYTIWKCQANPPPKECNGTEQCGPGEICGCSGYGGVPVCRSYYYQNIFTKEMTTAMINVYSCSKTHQCKLSSFDAESCMMKNCKNEYYCYVAAYMDMFGYPSSCRSGLTCNPNPGSQSSANDASPSFTLASLSATVFPVVVMIVAFFLLN